MRAVEIGVVELDLVTGSPSDERSRREHLAKLRDEVLKRLARRTGRLFPPELLEQSVGRDHLSCVDEKDRQERALLLAAERHHCALVDDLERAEDPKLGHANYVTRRWELSHDQCN